MEFVRNLFVFAVESPILAGAAALIGLVLTAWVGKRAYRKIRGTGSKTTSI